MARKGIVDMIITEDSDLVLFGCPKVLLTFVLLYLHYLKLLSLIFLIFFFFSIFLDGHRCSSK